MEEKLTSSGENNWLGGSFSNWSQDIQKTINNCLRYYLSKLLIFNEPTENKMIKINYISHLNFGLDQYFFYKLTS